MDAKKICLILAITLLIPSSYAWAGQTSLSGASRCFMPVMIGFNTPAPAISESKEQIKETENTPIPEGVSGDYLISKEEKTESKKEGVTITVYSIYAK
jgi:hypothetical protein